MFIFESLFGFFWILILTLIALSSLRRVKKLELKMMDLLARLDTTAPPISPETSSTSEEAIDEPEEHILEPASQAKSPIPEDIKSDSQTADEISIEGKLTSRWLVWLGAATLALGSVFLVKYSVEQGLLKPPVRIALGILVGIGLVFGGEWLRRRPLQKAIASVQPDYIPMALSGAGVCAIYANIFAAQSLYSLISTFWSFVFLAVISVGSVGLSLLQGPFIAALGITGGFLVPALIPSDEPSAWGLFSYIFLITCSGLGIIRYMNWRWLTWITLIGALVWPILWMVKFGTQVTPLPISMYLVVTFVGFYFLNPTPMENERIEFRSSIQLHQFSPGLFPLIASGIGIAFCSFLLTNLVSENVAALVAIAVISLSLMGCAYKDAKLNLFLGLAALLVLSVLVTWDMPLFVDIRPVLVVGNLPSGLEHGPAIPPQLMAFVSTSIIFSVLFGVGSFVGSRNVQHPAFWTSVSAAIPLLVLINAYGKILKFDAHIGWAIASLALAGVYVFATSYVSRSKPERDVSGEMASYAVAAVGALVLALTMSLREAWLSVAISLLVPGIAIIYQQLKLPALRDITSILAGIVIARLALNSNIFDYAIGDIPGINWMLYAYGISAIAFYWSARKYREDIDDRVVGILEAGALIFAVLLVSLEIRHFVNDGPIDVRGYSLFEQSLQSLAWLAGAYGLYKQNANRAGIVQTWGFSLLGGLATVQIIVLQILLFNPLKTGVSVWETPVLNLLFFAYGLPALFALLFFFEARKQKDLIVEKLSGAATLILIFITITLEIRQMFQGEFIKFGPTSNGEWYSYSVAWLVYAGILLALGILKQSKDLRYASLVLVLMTVSKVFLWDMAELEGLYRVGSFFALGGCLIGIGYVYQRFLLKNQT
jgi:uncharacterized membrane protein